MEQITRMYCSLWGLTGCQIFSVFDAIKLVVGTFALACLAIWAFGFVYRRR